MRDDCVLGDPECVCWPKTDADCTRMPRRQKSCWMCEAGYGVSDDGEHLAGDDFSRCPLFRCRECPRKEG